MVFNGSKSPDSSPATSVHASDLNSLVSSQQIQANNPVQTAASGKGVVTIGEGTRITGVIEECSMLDVRGILDGDVVTDRVIVRTGGGIRGNIQARNAEIYGTVEGTLNVAGHLDVKSTGNVTGDVLYVTLAVEKGAEFKGAVQCEQMIDPEALATIADVAAPSNAAENDPEIIETYEVKPKGPCAIS